MKGFPNQVAELPKIATGMQCLVGIEAAGQNGKDDGIFGEALVRSGVAGTGHTPKPVETYLREQRKKPIGGQSFRTTARGLRELYRLMGLIDDTGPELATTSLGKIAASFAGKPLDQPQVDFWRRVISNTIHSDHDGTSHPYQVLLRLVARKPGISRAKCALALEARNDSLEELDRIVKLAKLSEQEIIETISVRKSNWDNAKKVLPRFAEQLGDVIRSSSGTYVLADAPGRAVDQGAAKAAEPRKPGFREPNVPKAPRSSRQVTSGTIGMAGIGERSDEVPPPLPGDPAAVAAAAKLRAERLRRHNLLVREFSSEFERGGAKLYENPFDILALFEEVGILVEVKTLDGTEMDERERVRDAIGQLLYYEGFLTAAVAGQASICKIACFETKINDEHRKWLNGLKVGVVWKQGKKLIGDQLARDFVSPHVKEFGRDVLQS
ncbi:MAG: hypothetical protein L6Q71_08715 [Planctomycetes bacterium]|nr:hypothetical protein [Planctomycetota bacterium]